VTGKSVNGVHCARFDDFDACASALLPWEIEAVQLDRGPFAGELVQARSSVALVSEITFGRALHQRGQPPRGMRTLGVPADPAQRVFFRKDWTHSEQLMFFPSGSELDSVSLPGFHVFSVSLSTADLSETSQVLGGADFEGLLSGREVVDCSPGEMQSVRRSLREFVESARHPVAPVGTHSATRDRGLGLLQQIVEILTHDADPGPTEPFRNRELAVRRSLELIEASERTAFSVVDLCRQAGVSRRTLEYAFRERFGLTPKAYMLARRLDGVRSELRSAPGGQPITRIANRWGFEHLSRFAALYRRQFGELPSQTIRTNRFKA
jgi:AraC family ethanolamine operon transcriptional activator